MSDIFAILYKTAQELVPVPQQQTSTIPIPEPPIPKSNTAFKSILKNIAINPYFGWGIAALFEPLFHYKNKPTINVGLTKAEPLSSTPGSYSGNIRVFEKTTRPGPEPVFQRTLGFTTGTIGGTVGSALGGLLTPAGGVPGFLAGLTLGTAGYAAGREVGDAAGLLIDEALQDEALSGLARQGKVNPKYKTATDRNSPYYTNLGIYQYGLDIGDLDTLINSDVPEVTAARVTRFLVNQDGIDPAKFRSFLGYQPNMLYMYSFDWNSMLTNQDEIIKHVYTFPQARGIWAIMAVPGFLETVNQLYSHYSFQGLDYYTASKKAIAETLKMATNLGNAINQGQMENIFNENSPIVLAFLAHKQLIDAGMLAYNEQDPDYVSNEQYVKMGKLFNKYRSQAHQAAIQYTKELENAGKPQPRQAVTKTMSPKSKPQATEPKQTPYIPFYMHGAK